MIKLPTWLARHIPDGALAFDISVIFGGFSLQLLTQMGWLLLAVRVLGPDGYGIFASLTGITMAVGSFVGWGCGSLLIRGASAHPETLRDWFGHSLIAIVATALPLMVVGVFALPLMDFGPLTQWNLLAVLVADLLFGRAAQMCVSIHMATGKSARQSSVSVIIGACRLAGIAIAALLYTKLTLSIWAWWYLGSSTLAAVICVGGVVRHYGWPRWCWMPGILRDGFSFSAENVVASALKDLDKPIVLEMLGASAAGHYATAFRVIETLAMPIYALGYATYGKMFRKAAESSGACLAYSLKLLPLAAGMGLAVGLGALICADALPFIFGPAYAELPWLVRLLSPMPALIGLIVIGSDALSAVGRQTSRLVLVSVSLGITLLLFPWAIRMGGIEGAIGIRLLSALTLAILVWAWLPWRQYRRIGLDTEAMR